MPEQQGHALRTRKSFAEIDEIMDMPNLIAIQRNSYDWFLKEGLSETFAEVSPIQDFTDTLELNFDTFEFGEPKYDVKEFHFIIDRKSVV